MKLWINILVILMTNEEIDGSQSEDYIGEYPREETEKKPEQVSTVMIVMDTKTREMLIALYKNLQRCGMNRKGMDIVNIILSSHVNINTMMQNYSDDTQNMQKTELHLRLDSIHRTVYRQFMENYFEYGLDVKDVWFITSNVMDIIENTYRRALGKRMTDKQMMTESSSTVERIGLPGMQKQGISDKLRTYLGG